MPLLGPIKKAVVNCHSNTSITNMRGVCSNKHGLVMLRKVTSKIEIGLQSPSNVFKHNAFVGVV